MNRIYFLLRFGKDTYAELNGKKFVHVKVYKGSSDFDSREMAILIDGIISEAEKLGISTITPAEAERMKSAWGNG